MRYLLLALILTGCGSSSGDVVPQFNPVGSYNLVSTNCRMINFPNTISLTNIIATVTYSTFNYEIYSGLNSNGVQGIHDYSSNGDFIGCGGDWNGDPVTCPRICEGTLSNQGLISTYCNDSPFINCQAIYQKQ